MLGLNLNDVADKTLLEHFLDGALELAVVAIDVVLGGVIDLDVG